eukprot:COSAG02_NODE_1979_length_10203_cov_19.985748_9_plen_361_part_00
MTTPMGQTGFGGMPMPTSSFSAASPAPPLASISSTTGGGGFRGGAAMSGVPPSAGYTGGLQAAQPQSLAGAPAPTAGQQGHTWQRPVDTRDPLFAAQFHAFVRVRGLVRAAIAWVLLVAPLLVSANALFNILGGQPWYVRTLRMAANPMVGALVALQLAAAVGHAYILDVPAPGSSSSPVTTPFAQAALLLSLSTILSTLAFACVGACSAALLFWWKAHQILPASAGVSAGVSDHEVTIVTAWWFRCFYLGGGAVGLAHGIMLRWARKHVLSFPPQQRRMLPRLRESLPSIAVGAVACILRAMTLVMVLLLAWTVVVHGSSVTRSSWWADRFTTTVLALGLAPSSVCSPTVPSYLTLATF